MATTGERHSHDTASRPKIIGETPRFSRRSGNYPMISIGFSGLRQRFNTVGSYFGRDSGAICFRRIRRV
jgi:hypothetical protein